jgi:transposase, IS6 family
VTKPRPVAFKWRQLEPQLILMAVDWYLRFSLSYRDVEELLQVRGMSADHVTVWRWVQRYAPELDRRLRSHLKPTNRSWRVDETYIRVKGKWTYLYRAWTRPVPASIFCSPPGAMQQQPSGSFKRHCVHRTTQRRGSSMWTKILLTRPSLKC